MESFDLESFDLERVIDAIVDVIKNDKEYNKECQTGRYVVFVETVDKTQPQTQINDMVFWMSDKEVNVGDHIYVDGAPYYTGEAIVVSKSAYTTAFEGELSCTFMGYPIENR